jgi:hypothetical protein
VPSVLNVWYAFLPVLKSMNLTFLKYSFFLTVAFLLQWKYDTAGQASPNEKNDCESHISINGSSNINQFQLINYDPKIVRRADKDDDEKREQRIEIPVYEFKGRNKQIEKDFLEMVNASRHPFIIMHIEPRNLADCRKKGSSDFNKKSLNL